MVSQAKVGLIGCGTVGSEVARILVNRRDSIVSQTGVSVEIAKVAVADLAKARDVPLPPEIFTNDPFEIVNDPDIDIVVELVGGLEPPYQLITAALEGGKSVITANKALLARYGPELLETASRSGVDLLFEAAVGGGIPLIRPLLESLAGEKIRRIVGVVNGTTNYILTRMTEDGCDYETALADAQRLGYAEANPTADLDGSDSAQKAAILASLAFRTRARDSDVYREGITAVTQRDIAVSSKLGFVIKLLAMCEVHPGGMTGEGGPSGEAQPGADAVSMRVFPALVPLSHPLATVRLAFNAVVIDGESAGEMMFYGRGAGAGPTAVAVVGDIIDVVRNRSQSARGAHSAPAIAMPIKMIDSLTSQFYLRLEVRDQPGVLADVASVFARHGVSIESVIQQRGDELGTAAMPAVAPSSYGPRAAVISAPSDSQAEAELVLVTHDSKESAMRDVVAELAELPSLERVCATLRVLNTSASEA